MRKIIFLLLLISTAIFAESAPMQNTLQNNSDAQYQQKILQLEQSQIALTKEVQTLGQSVNTLQEQIIKQQHNHMKWQNYLASLKSIFTTPPTMSVTYQNLLRLSIWLTAIIGIFLLLSLFKRDKSPESPPKTGKINDDYDFLGSKEGISAKLNLAQAYIDMEQMDLAKQVLEEILINGNNEQKELAKNLLTKIQ
jgi:FimV-like protein